MRRAIFPVFVIFTAYLRAQSPSVVFTAATTEISGSNQLQPGAITLDAAQNLYALDYNAQALVRLASDGSAPASLATNLGQITAVVTSPAGTIYVATGNQQILAFSPAGGQGSVYGTTAGVPAGLALDSAGRMFVTEPQNHAVEVIAPGGGQASLYASGFSNPTGLAFDSQGNLYIADSVVGIAVVPAAGGPPQWLFIDSTRAFSPKRLVLDAAGNIYFMGNGALYELTSGSHIPAAMTYLGSGISDLAVDSAGALYVARNGPGNNIVKVQFALANFGTATLNRLNSPSSLIFTFQSPQKLSTHTVLTQGFAAPAYFTETSNSCFPATYLAGDTCKVTVLFRPGFPGLFLGSVRLLDDSANVLATAPLSGSGSSPMRIVQPVAPQSAAQHLNAPSAITATATGQIFVADSAAHSISRLSAGALPITGLQSPSALAVDGAGVLYIADTSLNAILTVPQSGGRAATLLAGLNNPSGLALDGLGNLYIADTGNHRILQLPIAGRAPVPIGVGFNAPLSVALSAAGDIYVADSGNGQIVQLPASGAASKTLIDHLNRPAGLAVDAAGNIYFTEQGSKRVLFLPAGASTPIALGTSTLNQPSALALAPDGGLYVVDGSNIFSFPQSAPNRFDFPSLNFGDTGGSASLSLFNAGNQSLTLSRVAFDAGDVNFSFDPSNTCTAQLVLAPGATCNLAIDFTPQTFGLLSGTLSVDDNSLYLDPSTTELAVALNGSVRAPSGCAYALSADTFGASYQAASFSLQVSAPQGCAWSAIPQAPWISILTGARGTGNGSVTFNVAPNTNSYARSGFVQVAGKFVTVSQSAGCTYSINPASASAGASGGSGQVSILAPSGCVWTAVSNNSWLMVTAGAIGDGSGNVSYSIGRNDDTSTRTGSITIANFSFTVSQAAGSPPLTAVGVFQSGVWSLDADANGVWDGAPPDRYFTFAAGPNDIAVTGDWNGDGHTKVGVYHSGFWLLDMNGNGKWDGPNVDRFIALYGTPGEVPVVGDWNGDGRTKVGVYLAGTWRLDYNGDGLWEDPPGGADRLIKLGGAPGEIPVVGDWNSDGRTKVGVFNNGTWTLDFNGNGGSRQYTFSSGASNDIPVTGDWTGTRSTKIGIFNNGTWMLDFNGNGKWDGPSGGDRQYTFSSGAGDKPVTGDWAGTGATRIGVYNGGFWLIDFNGNGQWDAPAGGDRLIALGGQANEQPVVGRW